MSRIIRETQRRKLPLIGHIRCGEKVIRNGKEYPQSLDYFKATGDYAAMFHEVYGDRPQRISIVFISDNTDDSCNERKELRQGSKLYAYGNGKIYHVYDKKTDSYVGRSIAKEPELVKELETLCNSEFEDILTLRFIVLGVKKVFGYWQLDTKGSASSIPQIVDVFDTVQEMAGTVRNIPFDLAVEKVKSQKPESKSLFPVITLIPNVCKENLDKVGQLIRSGTEMSGLLTEQKIQELTPVVQKVIDVFDGELVKDAQFFSKGTSEELKKACTLLRNCKTMQDMDGAIVEIRKINLEQEDKQKANIIRLEILESLKGSQ